MKAAVIGAPGAAPRFLEFADPVATEDEVLVQVSAAGLHPIVRVLADGSHYAAGDEYPMIPGVDGVGRVVGDGRRVYFGGARAPFGTMAELAPAPAGFLLPVPDELSDAQAAALMNPGMGAYLALRLRAELAPGETVLVLGATGVSGQLAVRLARRLGAARVIAAGRNAALLDRLAADPSSAPDATVRLGGPDDTAALAQAIGDEVHVVIDNVWGAPAEATLAAIARRGFTRHGPRIRYVQVGQSAGDPIRLPAAALRSTDLNLMGSGGGAVPVSKILPILPEFLAYAASTGLAVAVDEVPLSDVDAAWSRPGSDGSRVVLRP